MIRFEDLEEQVQRYHPEADLELLRKAYVFSAREHKGQVRLSGEPYLSHPLKVAHILAEMKLDVELDEETLRKAMTLAKSDDPAQVLELALKTFIRASSQAAPQKLPWVCHGSPVSSTRPNTDLCRPDGVRENRVAVHDHVKQWQKRLC